MRLKALNLELEGLSTLQRMLLLELLLKRHPHFWSRLESHKCSWQIQKESIEEFIKNHSLEFVRELSKASLDNNGWKQHGDSAGCGVVRRY